jgi:hypothetical protein
VALSRKRGRGRSRFSSGGTADEPTHRQKIDIEIM